MRRLQLWFQLLLALLLIAAVHANADANVDVGTLVRRQNPGAGGNNGGNGGGNGGGNAKGGNGGNADGGNAGGGNGGGGNGGGGNAGGGNAGGGNADGGNADGGNADGGNAKDGNAGDNGNDANGGNGGNGNGNGGDGNNNGGDGNGNGGDGNNDGNNDGNGNGDQNGVVDDGGNGGNGGDDGDVIDGGSGSGTPIRVDIKSPKQVQEVGVLVKIGSTVDLKWAYSSPPTGGKVTIEATALLERDGRPQQGDPIVIAANLSIRTTEYEWDTRKSRGEWMSEQLETAEYTLNIYDSTLPEGETRTGRIAPFSGFKVKMYKPQRYLNFNAYLNQNTVPKVYYVGPTRWTGTLPAAAGTFVPTATTWLVTWASAIVLAYAAVLA